MGEAAEVVILVSSYEGYWVHNSGRPTLHFAVRYTILVCLRSLPPRIPSWKVFVYELWSLLLFGSLGPPHECSAKHKFRQEVQ